MFQQDGREYNCPYCNNAEGIDCARGVPVGENCTSTIEIEGVKLLIDRSAKIEPGETYVAKRNTGWKILTCKEVNIPKHVIIPREPDYFYDTWECAKVLEIL